MGKYNGSLIYWLFWNIKCNPSKLSTIFTHLGASLKLINTRIYVKCVPSIVLLGRKLVHYYLIENPGVQKSLFNQVLDATGGPYHQGDESDKEVTNLFWFQVPLCYSLICSPVSHCTSIFNPFCITMQNASR